jgi:hypothetical protein
MRKLRGGVAAAAAAVIVVLTPTTAANASTPSVSASPDTKMPYVTSTDTTVRQIAQCGNTVYAVGDFSTVGATNKPTLTRHGAFSWDATTGAISSWNPNANGMVDSIAFSADCASVYLAGAFTTLNGHTATRLVKVSSSTAAIDPAFSPAPTNEVFTIVRVGSRIFAGGLFTKIAGTSRAVLATVNATSGAIDNYVNLNVTGSLPNSGRKIYNFSLSPSGTKLLAMGSFTNVGGVARQQIFMIDLGATSATVDAWNSPDFSKSCASSLPFWVRGAGWSPDSQNVYIATTGARGASPLCDTAAKFSAAANSNLHAIWINVTGCDSLYSITADDTNVYIGGHQRWLGNPNGCDSAGPGAQSRPGVGSVSVSTGAVLPWNPTRSRGHGADDVLLTSAGLWVASDTYLGAVYCAGKYRPGICFFPRT